MKKLFVLFVLLASFAMAQSQTVVVDCGTLAQVTQETHYANLGDWSRIDSVGLTIAATGEVDIDSVAVYPGFTSSQGGWYSSTAYTFLTDVDLAASTKGWYNSCNVAADKDAATVLTSAVMRGGINSLKVNIRGAATTDPTDPNTVLLIFRIWGIPKGGS